MGAAEINSLTVLGAGNMGHGIAEVAALAGYDVTMRDIEGEVVQDGSEMIEWSLNKLAEKGRISQGAAEKALDRVTPVVDIEEAVRDADFIIEAVPEKMEIKTEVYQEVEEYAPERAIFATNTSSLSITDLSEVTDRPEQFCGMHFFNPPVRMQLVEIIAGAHSAEETLAITEDLAESMDKIPVRVRKDSPGFIVNRVLVPLMNEAAWIVHEGNATVEQVDGATTFDVGLPMGSFELADQVGIDVGLHVLEYLHETLGDAYEPCPLLVEKVEAGELGKKTGKGFYDYEDGVAASTQRGDDDSDERSAPDRSSEHCTRIANRLKAVMANEVAKLVETDVASVEDIDQAAVLGAGLPNGPAKLADEAGLDVLVETLDERREETGAARYEVSDYLCERADEGGFYAAKADVTADGYDYETLTVVVEDHVGTVTIDRPHRMNTINQQMLADLSHAIDALEANDQVRAILLVGEGDRAFSAGVDVQGMAAGGTNPLDTVELSRQGQATFGTLTECDMPVVAGIDGYCLGGGMELATCADLRIASERSEFGQPELDLGLMPGWGGTQRLAPIVGEGRAREIILTTDRYDAETMAEYDFVNEVVPDDELPERAFELAADLAAGPPIAQRSVKRAMLAGRDDRQAGLEIEAQAFGHLVATDDLLEGIMAFVGDEEPKFEGK